MAKKTSMDFLVYVGDCVTPKWENDKKEKTKKMREEWRKKRDQGRSLNNHWYKSRRALTFGLTGWGFSKKSKVYFDVALAMLGRNS